MEVVIMYLLFHSKEKQSLEEKQPLIGYSEL
jgi:hypothetical protein